MYKVGDKVRLDIAGQVKTIGEIVEVKCGCYDYRVTCPEYPAPHGILIPKSEITGAPDSVGTFPFLNPGKGRV